MTWDELYKMKKEELYFSQNFDYSRKITTKNNYFHDKNALLFLSISNWKELSYFLKISPLRLEQLINTPNYHEFLIPKKKGKPRSIQSPEKDLMRVQKILNRYLQSVYFFQTPECVHGFIPKNDRFSRSIISNAQTHVNKKYILSLDLKDYFSSIKSKRVKAIFTSWGFKEEISIALTLLCTFQGALPTGSPTSSVLANILTKELDERLIIVSNENQLTYSRYADDLTFSSFNFFSDNTIFELIQLIGDCGFDVNMRKIRCVGQNRKQKITGIVVNKKLSVDRKVKKNIRAILHDLKTNGLKAATIRHYGKRHDCNQQDQLRFLNKIKGLESFVKMVEKRNVDLTS